MDPRMWSRFIPMIAYHHVLMSVLAIEVLFFALLLAGCSSSKLGHVYLLSLEYKNPSTLAISDETIVNTGIAHAVQNVTENGDPPTLQVRAGYMGLCIMPQDGEWICSTSAKSLANIMKISGRSINGTRDPLNLIYTANSFKENIVFDGLLFIVVSVSVICFLMLGTFPGWHEEMDEDGEDREVKPFPSSAVSQAALGASSVGFAFSLISILWQHINSAATADMAEKFSYGQIAGHVGPTAMAFGWIGTALIGGVTFGLLVMILSINLIRRLTEDE